MADTPQNLGSATEPLLGSKADRVQHVPAEKAESFFKRVFKAFHYHDFRVLWIGACTSSIGTWMQAVAQNWLVFQLAGAFFLGLDSFLGQIPILLFSLLGGVIADRFDRRFLLIGSQIIQLTCAFLLSGLYAAGIVKADTVWIILTLSFFVGFAQSFGGPAYQALIPTLVKSPDLPNAIALNSIQFNLARVIGPTLGGIALVKLGAAWCFALNGVSYIAVIISLIMVRPGHTPQRNSGISMMTSMKEGIRFIRVREGLGPLIVLAFLMTFLGIPLLTFLPVVVKSIFNQGPSTFTIMLCTSGAGAILGALSVAAMGSIKNKGQVALLSLIALGTLIAAYSLSRSLVLSCILLFLAGAALMATFAMISSLVQLIVPDEIRGRVMSVYNVAFRGGMPIGSLICGALIPKLGVSAILAANGVLLCMLGLYFLLVQRKVATL